MYQVVKRDGEIAEFNVQKISACLLQQSAGLCGVFLCRAALAVIGASQTNGQRHLANRCANGKHRLCQKPNSVFD